MTGTSIVVSEIQQLVSEVEANFDLAVAEQKTDDSIEEQIAEVSKWPCLQNQLFLLPLER